MEAIMKKQVMLGIIVGTAVIATPVSFNQPSENHAIVTLNSAEAKVGQPLSAGSVAGLNEGRGDGSNARSNCQFRRRTPGALVTAGRCGAAGARRSSDNWRSTLA